MPNKNRIRHLKQYDDMSDEEFDEMWEERTLNSTPSKKLEDRISLKLEEFSKDYDIDDLKINDKETLRALIQAIIALEDYEQVMFQLREAGLTAENINMLDKVSKTMSDLRSDISRLQDDLKITRKIRKSEQETSVLNYLETLKTKAREFYESKMMYILCPKCNMLLATIWTLYPTENNQIKLICHREQEDGSFCGEEVVVYTKDLLENKGSNKPEMLPESIL
jgi:hypothetical protein